MPSGWMELAGSPPISTTQRLFPSAAETTALGYSPPGPCEPGKGRPSVARAFSSGYAA